MAVTYRTTGNNVVVTCNKCGCEHRLMESHHVKITTPTGDIKGKNQWCRVREPGRVSAAREWRKVAYPETVSVTMRLCRECWWKVDMAARRGVCAVRNVND